MPPKRAEQSVHLSHVSQLQDVLLQVAETQVQTEQGLLPVRVVLDSGSQRSFLRTSVACHLGPAQTFVDLTLNSLGHSTAHTYPEHSIKVACRDGTSVTMQVIELNNILPPVSTAKWKEGAALFPKEDLSAYHHDTFEVDLLIGADYINQFTLSQSWKRASIQAFRTRLGTTLLGPLPTTTSPPRSLTAASLVNSVPPTSSQKLLSNSISDEQVNKAMDNFLDSIASEEDDSKKESDEKILNDFYNSIQMIDDSRYSVPLLWRPNHAPLPTNFSLARKWVHSLRDQLVKDGMFDIYNNEIMRQKDSDLIELVGPVDSVNTSPGHHFLPHFGVKRPDHPTTPLRVVFAANTGSPSLNDCLNDGPSLLLNLQKLLRRFRTGKFAYLGDIQKAFNCITLNEDERDRLQFLWFDAAGNLVVYRHKQLQFGPNCSPFIFLAVLRFHFLKDCSPEALAAIEQFYSDNLNGSVDDEKECLHFLLKVIAILAKGNFNLRNCLTNSPEINECLKKEGKLCSDTILSVLGMKWNSTTDTLAYQELPQLTGLTTKRQVLKFTASLFDPMGLLIYVSAPCMAFVTHLWSLGYAWDDPLPPDLTTEWIALANKAILASKTVVNRYHPLDKSRPVQLCVFTDSSIQIGAALAYLSQDASVHLVGGKYKIFGKKHPNSMTIPRKELVALQLGAKLGEKLVDTYTSVYPTLHCHLLSDSEISLHWLGSVDQKETFVKNRVLDIKTRTPLWSFYHVATDQNPSDIPTRPDTVLDESTMKLYSEGPSWLSSGQFPRKWFVNESKQELITLALTVAQDEDDSQPSIYQLIRPDNFNFLSKLLKISAIVLRIFHKDHSQLQRESQSLSIWFRDTQRKFFPTELAFLKSKKGHMPSLVRALRLFLDDNGILRCAGRFANAELPAEQKCPILLPKMARFTRLYVEHVHRTFKHLGLQQLISMVRRQVWIPNIRALCKKVIDNCTDCKKVHGKAYASPPMPDLPAKRLNLDRPYKTVGVDHTGSLSYRTDHGTAKGYVLIISCCVTRHVHLQLVPDMTTKSFIQALRYHAAIYGSMEEILCDNSKTFTSAETQLNEVYDLINAEEAQSFLAARRIKFSFIPKRSAWFGAHYERLIGILKNHMKRSIGRALLTEKDLTVCIAEIALVSNERPLTGVINDIDSLLPITPNLLVFGHELTSIPYPKQEQEDFQDKGYDQSEVIQDLYSQRAKIRNDFLERFRDEYYSTLRERHAHDGKQFPHQELVQTGDIVLIHHEEPRKFWKLGLVTKLIRGPDGQVRVAELRTQSGMTNRGIKKLYPIGVRHSSQENAETESQNNSDSEPCLVPEPIQKSHSTIPDNPTQQNPTRPRRRAAARAKTKITNILHDESNFSD